MYLQPARYSELDLIAHNLFRSRSMAETMQREADASDSTNFRQSFRETTSETIARINTIRELPSVQMIDHTVISTPNRQIYGKDGHVPCDHVCIFTYEDGNMITAEGGRELGSVVYRLAAE